MLFRARVAQYATTGNTHRQDTVRLSLSESTSASMAISTERSIIFVMADDRGNAATNGIKLFYPACPNSGACNTGPSTTNLSNQVGTTAAFVTTGPKPNVNWAAVSSTTDPRANLDTDVSSPTDKNSYKEVDGFFSFAVSRQDLCRTPENGSDPDCKLQRGVSDKGYCHHRAAEQLIEPGLGRV